MCHPEAGLRNQSRELVRRLQIRIVVSRNTRSGRSDCLRPSASVLVSVARLGVTARKTLSVRYFWRKPWPGGFPSAKWRLVTRLLGLPLIELLGSQRGLASGEDAESPSRHLEHLWALLDRRRRVVEKERSPRVPAAPRRPLSAAMAPVRTPTPATVPKPAVAPAD